MCRIRGKGGDRRDRTYNGHKDGEKKRKKKKKV